MEDSLPFDPSYYPEDFFSSRRRFLDEVRRFDATVWSYPVSTTTPELTGDLSIDIALIGDCSAKRKILAIAGTHGVEGFLGSAVQCALLRHLKSPPSSYAIVLVHCLNPWGMATTRRCNENNVDLNRNCLFNQTERVGAPEGYESARALILPDSTSSFRAFAFQALLQVTQHGFTTIKGAITGGQYIDPHGLFFGGSELQPEIEIFYRWIETQLEGTEHILCIDLHSGLGKFCHDTVLLDVLENSAEHQRIVSLFGPAIVHAPNSAQSLTYTTRGSLSNLIPRAQPNALADQLVHEFGTLHPFKVLHALVNENTSFFNDTTRKPEHITNLKEAFCPSSVTWRMNAVKRGLEVFKRAVCAFE